MTQDYALTNPYDDGTASELPKKMKLSTAVDLIANPAPALSRRMEKKQKRRAAELRGKRAAAGVHSLFLEGSVHLALLGNRTLLLRRRLLVNSVKPLFISPNPIAIGLDNP